MHRPGGYRPQRQRQRPKILLTLFVIPTHSSLFRFYISSGNLHETSFQEYKHQPTQTFHRRRHQMSENLLVHSNWLT